MTYKPHANRKAHPLIARCDIPGCAKPYYDDSMEGDYLCRQHWYEYLQVQLDSYNEFTSKKWRHFNGND